MLCKTVKLYCFPQCVPFKYIFLDYNSSANVEQVLAKTHIK